MADLWLTPDEVAELTARIRWTTCVDRLSSGVPAASGGMGRIMPGSPGGRLFGVLNGGAVASSAGVEHGFDLRDWLGRCTIWRMAKYPALDYLQSVVSYDEQTGVLRWKRTLGSRAKAGDVAGSKTARGHLVIRVGGQLVMAHQAAWAIHTGEWPAGPIRHVNGDYSDNRIANLVATTKREIQECRRAEAITPENVHAIFRYRDGQLYWRESLSGKHRIAGTLAGYLSAEGYVKVEVGGKAQSVHRVVWLMHNGEWPAGEIDHMNGNRADNRIGNLRDVTHRTNSENRRTPIPGTATGHLGVHTHQSGLFRARIRVNGKPKSLGLYDTPEQAHAAYVAAKRRLHAGNTL